MTTVLTLAPMYARSLLKRTGDLSHWPALSATESAITINPGHLRRYRKVVAQQAPADRLPPCYLQVLAFDPIMRMLTDSRFPLKLLGLVHVSNRIRQWSPIHVQDVLSMQVRLGELSTTHRGHEFGIMIDVTRGSQCVWAAEMGILSRARTHKARHAPAKPDVPTWEQWVNLGAVPAHTGPRYANVSGDFNPIHLSAWSARLFGFPRAIAHGMWTLARGLASMDSRLFDGPYELDVRFHKPVFLPSPGLWLATEAEKTCTRLAVTDASRDTLHLTGTLKSAETDTPSPAR